MCPDCKSTNLFVICHESIDVASGYHVIEPRYECGNCGAKWDQSEIDAFMAMEEA